MSSQLLAEFLAVDSVSQPLLWQATVEFPDGQIAVLAFLCEGRQATVFRLPEESKTVVESEASSG